MSGRTPATGESEKPMLDYIFFMHSGTPGQEGVTGNAVVWEQYLATLRSAGRFQGGSSIGVGECVSKSLPPKQITSPLSGYIRVQAHSLEDAKTLLTGNPVFEAGGTVEIRELPRD
jgi:hypothetical protein